MEPIIPVSNAPIIQRFQNGIYSAVLGKSFVVWEDARNIDEQIEIYGQFFDSEMNDIGGEFMIIPHQGPEPFLDPYVPAKPAVAYSSNNDEKFLLVWQEGREGSWDIWGQVLDSEGALIGDSFKVNNEELGSEYDPNIDYNSIAGKFLVTWWVNTDNTKIYARVFNGDGTPFGLQFKIADGTFPVATSDKTDDFFVSAKNGQFITGPWTPPPIITGSSGHGKHEAWYKPQDWKCGLIGIEPLALIGIIYFLRRRKSSKRIKEE